MPTSIQRCLYPGSSLKPMMLQPGMLSNCLSLLCAWNVTSVVELNHLRSGADTMTACDLLDWTLSGQDQLQIEFMP